MRIERSYHLAIKDIKEIFSSISIYGPMIGVPLFFSIILPIMTFYVTIYAAPNIVSRITALPTAPQQIKHATSEMFLQYFAVNILGPIFLTMPILTASVIAADSFAGEKERKTSDALLATPISNSELLLGKVLASFIPTLILTLAVFLIYGGITNYFSMKTFGAYILPTTSWLLMIVSGPFLAIVTIGVMVLVSAKVRGIKEAQQVSTLLILPVLIIPFTSVLGIATLNVGFFEMLIFVLIILDVLILYASVRSFKKEGILG